MKKKVQKNSKQNSRDQQTAVLEDINSKFGLVLEKVSGLDEKIDANHQEFLEFRDRTDENLKVALEYLFRINEEIQDMRAEVKDLKKLLKDKADLDRLESMEKRLIKLEKLVLAKLA